MGSLKIDLISVKPAFTETIFKELTRKPGGGQPSKGTPKICVGAQFLSKELAS